MQNVYTINEITSLVVPIARAYGVKRVALFGSYARGEAKPDSDIDLHLDKGNIKGLFQLAGFQRKLEETLAVPVDVLTTGALSEDFLSKIKKKRSLFMNNSRNVDILEKIMKYCSEIIQKGTTT
ncbi:MAG: nucleotidyltransferase family protein [Oscillospiraceae bacterium]|nr:nucleotidyltransferase family protein [Oscillospiraceae bacterium]